MSQLTDHEKTMAHGVNPRQLMNDWQLLAEWAAGHRITEAYATRLLRRVDAARTEPSGIDAAPDALTAILSDQTQRASDQLQAMSSEHRARLRQAATTLAEIADERLDCQLCGTHVSTDTADGFDRGMPTRPERWHRSCFADAGHPPPPGLSRAKKAAWEVLHRGRRGSDRARR